jgi:hypothetical protein
MPEGGRGEGGKGGQRDGAAECQNPLCSVLQALTGAAHAHTCVQEAVAATPATAHSASATSASPLDRRDAVALAPAAMAP